MRQSSMCLVCWDSDRALDCALTGLFMAVCLRGLGNSPLAWLVWRPLSTLALPGGGGRAFLHIPTTI